MKFQFCRRVTYKEQLEFIEVTMAIFIEIFLNIIQTRTGRLKFEYLTSLIYY